MSRARKCSFAEKAEDGKMMKAKKDFLNRNKTESRFFVTVICYNKTKIVNWADEKSEVLFGMIY